MGISRAGLVVVAAALALGGCGSDSPTEPSLFRAEDLVVGSGDPAVAGDSLTVHYIGSLENGQVFESSYVTRLPLTTVSPATLLRPACGVAAAPSLCRPF
jgi:hypothetical protein